nr:MAG TPA: hypothetical protein [Caudoviricetes sp.]
MPQAVGPCRQWSQSLADCRFSVPEAARFVNAQM